MLARYVAIAVILFLSGCANNASPPLLTDPNWSSETLANGFRYHLYPIEGQEIEMRLIVNVGSLSEREQERGYAHFIEHMAFNGSRRFPHNTVFEEFAQVGVEFGPDINAITDYGRTIYQLSLPDNQSLPKALDWFRDIGDGLTLDESEVKSEIGVIFGEWRQDDRQDASWPMKLYESTLAGSLYANRDPIGTELTLTNVTPESLRRFYRHWYQANQMQLVVTGGFDVNETAQWIEEEFASLPSNNPQPAKHELPPLSSNGKYPTSLSASKGESPAIVISIQGGEDNYPNTLAAQRALWQRWMLLDAIQLRLEEQFDRQGISHNGLFIDFTFSPGKSVYELVVDFNAADREAMVDALAHNLAALRDSGITNAEYQALVEQYAANVQFDDIQFPLDVAEKAVSDLYFNRLPQSQTQLESNFRRFLSLLSLDDINRELTALLDVDNQAISLVYAAGEESADAAILQQSYLEQVAKPGEAVNVTYADVEIPAPTVSPSVAGKITEPAPRLFVWTLENGLPVHYYRLDDSQSETQMVLQAKGGIASLSTKERAALELMFETYRS